MAPNYFETVRYWAESLAFRTSGLYRGIDDSNLNEHGVRTSLIRAIEVELKEKSFGDVVQEITSTFRKTHELAKRYRQRRYISPDGSVPLPGFLENRRSSI